MTSHQNADCAVFTVCNIAYLHKALVLAESLFLTNGQVLKIFLIDRKSKIDLVDCSAEIIWIEDCEVPGLLQLAFKYDITEFSTAVKPFLTLRLLKSYGSVVFLDPDTCAYGSIEPILLDLEDNSIVLTPHYVTPHGPSEPDSDVGMMRFGSFNLGFYAVRRSAESIRFLEWWSDRCFRLGFFETQFGLSTDQKWISIVPCFFRDLKISFNLGYNMAFWNVHERRLSKDVTGNYLVNSEFPLVFFHFSSFDEAKPENLTKRPLPSFQRNRSDLHGITADYKQRLLRKKIVAPAAPYGFDYMSGGEYVSPTLRRAYACVLSELPQDHDPFDSAGPIGNFARKNHLFETRSRAYAPSGFADIDSHKGAFRVIYFAMRIVLRLIGPNRFANLSRLLVYLSSYRQNRPLWRL